ncbi:MAG: HAMP domain-containing sensor histidine kinase [Eubacteriales bacterium]|nr:HAMP domain-containing sensor histidine kinase [Eubacteriales bacterium]
MSPSLRRCRDRLKDGRRRPYSLKYQIICTFVGLLFLSILSITAVNGLFLERYYVSRKEEVLLDFKAALEELDVDALYWEESVHEILPEELRRASSRNNLTWVVVKEDNTSYVCWPENEDKLRSKLFFGYASDLDADKSKGKVLCTTDSYVVQQSHDRFAGMDYVECWGHLENGNYFLVRTPLESIRESAAISNKFYLWVGILIIFISGILIGLVTRRITKPISELTLLSQKMSNLDFEARYASHAGNEIDVLGDNFNSMSSQLKTTISELKSANNQLQKDIADRVKIDEMRKEFLDNVSHELKTPIALIQGYAEGLKEGISDDPESREFYCDVIMDEASKMNKLVKNLLTLNQLESGRDAAVMERFDLTALIRGVLSTMDIMVQQKGGRISFEEKEPVYVWADEFKTEEVVTNYVSNALHHLEGEMEVEIRILEEGDRVRVTVFNTGKPIPEADIPNLWNKFYKVDKARTREYGGSGIGLSIVRAIMEGMNQDYGVVNFDNGVEFWFTLDRK